ncbi:MAG: sodium-dependent transporter [Rikenellaceae bacterium]
MQENRGTFGGILGTIAVVGGSVVGLGNIWRFPYMAGENGGAVFILLYFFMSIFISLPIMISEFSIGRSTQSNSLGAFRKLSKNRGWQLVGFLGVFTAYVIMSYYAVIAGWSLDFIYKSASGSMLGQSPEALSTAFSNFVSSGTGPIAWMGLFLLLSCAILVFGVTKGIERANKVLMPLMVVILLGMVFNSSTLDGWKQGVNFLFHPDLSKLTWGVALQALGQSFFSMSLGMGAMIVYGSYIKRSDSLFKIAGIVAVSDLTIAILSGLAIFPAVFTFGIEVTSGAELVFLTLPNIFNQMAGGYYVSIAFFLLLFFAAITSSVSLLETIIAFITEEFKIKRVYSTIITFVTTAIIGSLCALSQMTDSKIQIFGMSLFDFNDTLSSIFMMPLCAIAIVIFVGWFLSGKVVLGELSSDGRFAYPRLIKFTYFMIKFIVPVVVMLLFISGVITLFA